MAQTETQWHPPRFARRLGAARFKGEETQRHPPRLVRPLGAATLKGEDTVNARPGLENIQKRREKEVFQWYFLRKPSSWAPKMVF